MTLGRRWWQLGTLLPILTAAFLAAELAGRLLPLDQVAFRAWEPALRRTVGGLGPFAPERVTVHRRAYGDLAAMGNLPRLRQYHDERLESDELGFRNPPGSTQTPPWGGIVTGDSFAIAYDTPAPQTLPGQLSRLTGAPFYNAGGTLTPTPEGVSYLAAALRLRSGWVVYELLERVARAAPPPETDAPPAAYAALRRLGDDAASPGTRLAIAARRFLPWAESPLQIECGKLVKRLEDGRLRPNSSLGAVAVGTLENGDEMLFIPWDLAPVSDVAGLAAAWQRHLLWFQEILARHHLRLLVLLVPNKHTVYGPLTLGGPREPEGAQLLAGIARELGAAGIPVIDATPELRQRAAAGLAARQYLYWRDDTHWNARGIGIAAAAVARDGFQKELRAAADGPYGRPW
jgi:acetyltransferase AlgX (SGNH hydrolase-like protein)